MTATAHTHQPNRRTRRFTHNHKPKRPAFTPTPQYAKTATAPSLREQQVNVKMVVFYKGRAKPSFHVALIADSEEAAIKNLVKIMGGPVEMNKEGLYIRLESAWRAEMRALQDSEFQGSTATVNGRI